MHLNTIITEFLGHCRTKDLSKHTLRAYRQDLGDFHKWVVRNDPENQFSREAMVAWISDMRERNLAPASVKRRVACLKVLCLWLEDEEQITDSPFHRLRATVRLPRRLPRNLTQDELSTLFGTRSANGCENTGIRIATLTLALELLFTTGIRIGELCSIQLQDIDFSSGIIAIKGKGNRERRVFLVDDQIKEQIIAYTKRRSETIPCTDALLVTRRGTPATPDHIRKNLHQRIDDLNLPRKITPHMLRHTAATQLLENGVDIRFVQKLLGHASISTTEIYTHVSDVKLQDAIRAANPRRLLGKA